MMVTMPGYGHTGWDSGSAAGFGLVAEKDPRNPVRAHGRRARLATWS